MQILRCGQTYLILLFSSWALIQAGSIGVAASEDGAITIGTPTNLSSTAGFWYLGGREPGALSSTFYMKELDKMDQDHYPIEGPDLSAAKYGHCAVNVKQQYESLDNSEINQIMIIGGHPHEQSVTTYCKRHDLINEAMCQEGEPNKFNWAPFKDLNEKRNRHLCTVFQHETEGLIILVTQGEISYSTELFRVEKCSQCKSNCTDVCSWKYDLNGKPIIWMGGSVSLVDSAIAIYNGIPTTFGGMNFDGEAEVSGTTHMYELSEDDDMLKWAITGHSLKSARKGHAVVAVPLSFLCAEEEATSTER